jgi:hypothetical protein
MIDGRGQIARRSRVGFGIAYERNQMSLSPDNRLSQLFETVPALAQGHADAHWSGWEAAVKTSPTLFRGGQYIF